MADFTLDGRTKVKTLRVYKSASCKGGFADDTELADNNMTLLEAGSEPVSSKPEETCETEEENVDYYANAPWPKFSFPSSWDEFEDLVEAFAVAAVKRYGIFFSRNYVLGFLGLYVIGYVFGGLLTGPVMLYYLAKFLIRLIRISKGTYVPTPESKKGTLIPVLNNQWSEYAEWVKEFPIWGILGYIYVWLVVAVLLLPLTIVYIPYNIIRKNWDNKLAK